VNRDCKKYLNRLNPNADKTIMMDIASLLVGCTATSENGVNISKTILDPIRAPINNRSLKIFLFKRIAVRRRSNKSKEKFKNQITSK
jgi:hypothetical protein